MNTGHRISLTICVLVLLALVVPPHLLGIARFSDIDEPFWVINGANYYYALTHRDFENTVYEYHPGVTNTWVVAAGMLSVFPEYRGLGQGYFDPHKWNFEEFLREQGRDALPLVRASRIIQTMLLVLLAVLLFFLLQLLIDRLAALAVVILAFDAPFFLGHSRLLNNEGMLAMFVVVSIVSMLVYLRTRRKLIYLLISGASFGLAQLTKSPSIVVIPVIGLMLFLGFLDRSSSQKAGARLLQAVKVFALWLLAAAVIYVILWPGMWVAPGRMLYEVYGNAFSYAFQGARLDVTQELQPATFRLDTSFSGVVSYASSWALRSTPLTWLGSLLALAAVLSRRAEQVLKSLIGYISLTALLFVLMFGIAQGRNSPHYILTTYVCMDVVAGLGWGFGIAWLVSRWPVFQKEFVRIAAFSLIVLLQLASGLPYYPYYYTYPNPLLAHTALNSAPGYGEGLDLAANYLSQKQDAEGLRAFVYNGMGTFSYFFPGKVRAIKSPYFLVEGMPDVIQGMRWAQYLVVYSIVQKDRPESAHFLATLEKLTPEQIIMLDGHEYVRIYRTEDIPESIYAELAENPAAP